MQAAGRTGQTGLSFTSAADYGSGGITPIVVITADVNGDGKADVIALNACGNSSQCDGDGTVAVLLGNGDGTFLPAVTYDSGSLTTYSIAVADVNGDGRPDLMVATACCDSSIEEGNVAVLLGNGDGTFQTPINYDSGATVARSLKVADINNDGKPDLLVANECVTGGDCIDFPEGQITVLLGNGDGTFQSAVAYSTGGDFAMDLAVADVNGDGRPDIVVANWCPLSPQFQLPCQQGSASVVSVLLGVGDGTFQAPSAYDPGGWNSDSVALADVNDDGKLDIVVGNNTGYFFSLTGAVGVLLGNGDGTFQPVVPYTLAYPVYSVSISDVNGDGKPDLVAATQCDTNSCGDGVVGILLGVGDGTFQAATSFDSGGKNTQFVSVADINGDAKPDLLTANQCFSDGNCDSGAIGVLINTSPAATKTTLVSAVNPSIQGKSVPLTVVVSSLTGNPSGTPTGTPSGKVEYLDGTTILASVRLTSGSATYIPTKLLPGAHNITALYLGDSNDGGSASAPLAQMVLAVTSTTLNSTPNPSAYGQTIVLSATITSGSGAPPDGETVTFKQGSSTLGTGMLSGGSATLSYSSLGIGTKGITAVYEGDSIFAASNSNRVEQVIGKDASTTTLVSSLNPSNAGQSVTFTATVVPNFGDPVAGTVTFYDGTTVLKTVPTSGGVAKFTTSALGSGGHTIQATYNGGQSLNGSSVSLTQTVN